MRWSNLDTWLQSSDTLDGDNDDDTDDGDVGDDDGDDDTLAGDNDDVADDENDGNDEGDRNADALTHWCAIFLCYLGFEDDHHKNTIGNDKDHLVGSN